MNSRIHKIRVLAEENLYKSVIRINKRLEEEEKTKDENYLTFGVKNTNDISLKVINKLREKKKYLLTTIDKMSSLGRSIDTDLINPLTYRLMTGSSSGTAINIIKGINDFGIGTDGGGSVLAPALSCNLYSFIGSGIGALSKKESLSTDKISFQASLGVISKSFEVLKVVIEDLLEKEIKENSSKIRVIIPYKNNLLLPDNTDMREEINKVIKNINKDRFEFIDYSFDNIYHREIGIKEIKEIFNNNLGDLILTYEGPIDVYGYDETIQRSFKGIVEKQITSNGGKGLIKAANICKCTSITVPGEKLASGFVICGKEGEEGFNNTFNLAELIEDNVEKNEMFLRYFINREKFVSPIDKDIFP